MKIFFTAVSKSWKDESGQIVNIKDTMSLEAFFKKLKEYQKILNPKKPNADRWILDFSPFKQGIDIEIKYYDDYAE